MPPEDDGDSPADDPIAAAVAAVDAELAQTPANIRSAPEFKALEATLRSSARARGAAEVAARDARTEAETYRQAAEAQRQAALDAEISALPEAAVAAYQELATLGETDPVAAARRLAELLSAQSVPAAGAGDPPPDPKEGNVPANQPPPPMGSGADGNAALATPKGEDIDEMIAGLDKRYADVVARNQDPVTRNRVTMKERASGMIAYLASAYVQATRTDKP